METGNDNFEIRRGSADTSQGEISISASYPIPDSKVRNATVRHPYYSFIIPDSTEMQWQTFPAAYGPLRHTLVKTNSTQGPGELPRDEDVEAIFHHIWNSALPLGREQSEGVLILPDKFGRELELLYVGSLMGLLWQVRRLATSDSKGSKKAHKHDSEAGDVKFTRKLFSKVFFKKQ